MEDHLIDYLLDTLDPVTRQRVESYLRTHPEARGRLEQLKQVLVPLDEDREDPEPPPGLFVATLGRIAEHQSRHLPPAPIPSPHQLGTPPRRWLRRADWIVAAALLVIVGGLGSSLLTRQWQLAQRTACANNLRTFWGGLGAYADRGDGHFPRIEAEGPRSVAAVFVPTLSDAGVLPPVSVLCPAQGQRPVPALSLPEFDRLYRDQPDQFRDVAREVGGNYAYTLGYQNGNHLQGLDRTSGDHLPILADGPPPDGHGNSLNHAGSGQNVLSVGGAVRWCAQTTVGENGDDIYLNQQFQVRAGLNRTDTVLGMGDASPERP